MDFRLKELKRVLESAVQGMSEAELGWHPVDHPTDKDKWCTAQVLEHLYLTYTGTIKGFEKVVQAGKPLATHGSNRQKWRAFVVLGFGYLPSGRKAPPNTAPRGLAADQVRMGIWKKIVAMDAVIAQCEERFGSGTRLLDHPILGPLTATQWRKFHLLHGRHHRKQILRLRRAMKRVA